ncbi:MAG: hypothetical protein ACRDRL_21120 [Sciscionella sp.]
MEPTGDVGPTVPRNDVSPQVTGGVVESAEHTVRSAVELTETLRSYGLAARGTATACKNKGDSYGESLATTRATVYDQAAELLKTLQPPQAAEQMMEQARQLGVRTPPLLDFDRVGRQYITAQAWQFCAWEIDPTLEKAAPQWD